MISLSQERTDSLLRGDMRTKPAHPPHDLQREFTNSSCCRCSSAETNSRMVGQPEVIQKRAWRRSIAISSKPTSEQRHVSLAENHRCDPVSAFG